MPGAHDLEKKCRAAFLKEIGSAKAHAALAAAGRLFVGRYEPLASAEGFVKQALQHHAAALAELDGVPSRVHFLKSWLREAVLAPLIQEVIKEMGGTEEEAQSLSTEWAQAGKSLSNGLACLKRFVTKVQKAAAKSSKRPRSPTQASRQPAAARAKRTLPATRAAPSSASAPAPVMRAQAALALGPPLGPPPSALPPTGLVRSSSSTWSTAVEAVLRLACATAAGPSRSAAAAPAHATSTPVCKHHGTVPGRPPAGSSAPLLRMASAPQPAASGGAVWPVPTAAPVVQRHLGTVPKTASCSAASGTVPAHTAAVTTAARPTAAGRPPPSGGLLLAPSGLPLLAAGDALGPGAPRGVALPAAIKAKAAAQAAAEVAQAAAKMTVKMRSRKWIKGALDLSASMGTATALPSRAPAASLREPRRVKALLQEQGWALEVAEARTHVDLQRMLTSVNPRMLGKGRDVAPYRRYSALQVAFAWHIRCPERWASFDIQRTAMARDCARAAAQGATVPVVSSKLNGCLQRLSEPLQPNEGWFLHGTGPESVLPILSSGLSERMCAGTFGKGVYLAEDPEKADQYALPDRGLLGLHSAHFSLPAGQAAPEGEDLFFMFVVRAAAGLAMRTRDGTTEVGRPLQPVFASEDQRELSEVPGVTPPLRHHSLVVELGESLQRFREFVHFSSSRFHMEYLLAYRRL